MNNAATTRRSVIRYEVGPFAVVSMGLPGDHEGQTAVRVFLVRGGDTIGLIDSGLHAGFGDMERGFGELGLSVANLDMLLLTHEHMDHVGNNGVLKQRSGCTILGSAERADRVADNRLNATTIVHAFPDVAPLFDLDREYLSWMGPLAAPIDRTIADGEHVRIGSVCLEVVAVPGHSAAELGFFDPQSRTLVLADPLLPSFNPVLYLYEDPAQMRATFDNIERFVKDRDVETVLLAHDDAKSRAETIDLIDDCRARVQRVEDSILDTLRQSPGIEFGALRDRVCDANGKVREWRALISIDASLRAFQAAGIARPDGRGWALA